MEKIGVVCNSGLSVLLFVLRRKRNCCCYIPPFAYQVLG